jgi:hypothetical protein
MRSIACVLISFAAALTASGCITEGCACPPLPASAVLHGRVSTFSGQAMSGATVMAYSAPAAGCYVDSGLQLDFGGTPTSSDGNFVLGLAGPGAIDSVCVFVFARPPADSTALRTSDTTLVVLDFRFGVPQDSARVDPILKAL